MKRKTELNLNAYGNGKYPNHNIFSKTALQQIFNIHNEDYVMHDKQCTIPKRKSLDNVTRVILMGVYDNSNIWSCLRSTRCIVKDILQYVSMDNYFKIGDFIDINPIYCDPGWKPATIVQFRRHSRQVQVKFKHSMSKRMLLYWVHLDNYVEYAPFGKGFIDEQQVKALFFATVSPLKYKITEVKNIVRNNHMDIYESILAGKCKSGNKNKYEIEKYLWHGTKYIDTLQFILKNGFDRSYNNAAAFGKKKY
eukprot:433116_1